MRSNLILRERGRRNRRRAIAAAAVVAGLAVLAAAGPVLLRHAIEASAAHGDVKSGSDGVSRSAAVSADTVAKPVGERADESADSASAAASASASTSLKTRPLSTWLGEIARESGRDLVLSPDLRGDLTASESTRLDWKTRLEAYSRVSGFEFTLSDGLIEARRGSETGRGGDAFRARTSGDGELSSPPSTLPAPTASLVSNGAPAAASAAGAPVPREPPPPDTRVVRLVHAPAKETAAVLARAGEALDVTVAADSSSNSLVLSGLQPGLGRVLRVLTELDRPRRRIHLEAKIIEVTRSARLDLGVEWKLTGTTVGGDVKFPPNVSDAGSAALVIATHGAAALDARISALEADGKLHVVSRPSVEMIEGSPATIESVRILRIRLPSNGTVVGDEVVAAPSSGRATEDIPVGVRLEVTPAIRGGTRVLLRIRAKSSNLGAPLPPDDIPEELSRMVDAEILVGNGETAVLGGLQREAGQNSGAGVPGVRKIPLLGSLFGKKSNVGAEEELLVLVTPRVLD